MPSKRCAPRFASAEALEYLFHRYGWAVQLDETVFGTVDRVIGIKAPVEEFLAAAGPLQDRLDERPGASLGPQEIVALGRSAETLIKAMADFRLSSLADLPPPLADPAFWQSIGEHLFDDLLRSTCAFTTRRPTPCCTSAASSATSASRLPVPSAGLTRGPRSNGASSRRSRVIRSAR